MDTGGLKEYYIRLQKLYENALNILNGINQSLYSAAPEITVNIVDSDDASQTVKIPSFLYMENRLEELSNTMGNLFDLPSSGEAWFTNKSDTFKLQLVRENTAPSQPEIKDETHNASSKANNILKDMVSPKTYIRMSIDNLPNNVDKLIMDKIIINDVGLFNALQNAGIRTYDEFKTALYNLKKGDDYDEYESILDLPIKKDTYKSNFKIEKVIEKPWKEDPEKPEYSWKLKLDTIKYYNQEDSSISYRLKSGDKICLGNGLFIYTVKEVNIVDNSVIIEETVGHIGTLSPFEDNSAMQFVLCNDDYSSYNYVDIPLEENPYIIVFVSSVYNNIRSTFSDGVMLNLNGILMKDEFGNPIVDAAGNNLTYMEYYKKYCTNIGDLILGISESAYPQISNYNPSLLQQLQEGGDITNYVNSTLDTENIVKVVAINKHLSDDVTSEDIISLHAQKNDINAQLQTLQSNIDQVYSKLISTDFSQDVTVSQFTLREQLKGYYADRTDAQKQINNIVDNINTKASELNISIAGVKYRIRGITVVDELEKYLHNISDAKCDVIGLEVEYKYKSTNKDTNNIVTIDKNTFTDWNRMSNIDRQRKLIFTDLGYSIEYVNYVGTDNIIKWNQIDIPITSGEDVIIRIRYKYNIGQPFINLYTPWSKEFTVAFPEEYMENVEVRDILEANNIDTIKSTFSKILINDGYTDHVQDSLIVNDQTFFHLPENIYSGFNTAENNLISLKDKLTAMSNDIDKYKQLIEQETNTKFDIYLNYDDEQVILTPNTINKINIYNTDHITDKYIKKDIKITIKNTGDTPVRLYSLFPGNTDTKLIDTDTPYYNQSIKDYDRVPVMFNNIIEGQHLGQWIYFRQNNPYTGHDIYLNNAYMNMVDYSVEIVNGEMLSFSYLPENYINKDNEQVLLPYRNRMDNKYNYGELYSYINNETHHSQQEIMDKIAEILRCSGYVDYSYEYRYHETFDSMNLSYSADNRYLTKYEDIVGTTGDGKYVSLDENTALSTFREKYSPINFETVEDLNGGFVYPDLLALSQVITDGMEKSSHIIPVGGSETIPVVFEYYVNGDQKRVVKSLYFDIRNSLISDPRHYMIEFIGNYDYTASSDIYANIDIDLENMTE